MRNKAKNEPQTEDRNETQRDARPSRLLTRRDVVRLGLVTGAGSAGYLFSKKGFGSADPLLELEDEGGCQMRWPPGEAASGQSGSGPGRPLRSPPTTPFVD